MLLAGGTSSSSSRAAKREARNPLRWAEDSVGGRRGACLFFCFRERNATATRFSCCGVRVWTWDVRSPSRILGLGVGAPGRPKGTGEPSRYGPDFSGRAKRWDRIASLDCLFFVFILWFVYPCEVKCLPMLPLCAAGSRLAACGIRGIFYSTCSFSRPTESAC